MFPGYIERNRDLNVGCHILNGHPGLVIPLFHMEATGRCPKPQSLLCRVKQFLAPY